MVAEARNGMQNLHRASRNAAGLCVALEVLAWSKNESTDALSPQILGKVQAVSNELRLFVKRLPVWERWVQEAFLTSCEYKIARPTTWLWKHSFCLSWSGETSLPEITTGNEEPQSVLKLLCSTKCHFCGEEQAGLVLIENENDQ